MSKNTVLKINEFPKCAVALIGSKDGLLLPSGSASLISPTLAVTAAHVIRDYENRFGNDYKLVGAIAKGISCQVSNPAGEVLGELATPDNVVARSAKQTAVIKASDLALIEFIEPFPPPEVMPATIRLRPPRVGEEVAGYGFVQSEAVPMNEEGTKINWRQAPWIGAGCVSKLYLRGRDQSLSYPAFEAVDIDWRAGTSGGPILDTEGRLLAIVSTGMSAYQDEPPVSFGSVIWPIIGAVDLLGLRVEDNLVCQDANKCAFDGLEHMRADKQPDGTVYTSYRGPCAE
jgi:hypothetical protein